ncbi:MAG: MFS transporter [Pseudomonadales bacterium]
MKPLHVYFLATGTWFLAFGMQSVVFAWLVTMVLNESPGMVGIAQMALLLPTMLLMLVGGSLADHYGGRRIAMLGQLAASIAPLFLTCVVVFDELTYGAVIIFAVLMGCAQALVTPARDGLLALVADGLIQRRVVQVSMIQFGVQMIGFIAASFADALGARAILMMQFVILLVGTFAYFKLDVPYVSPASFEHSMITQIKRSIVQGFLTVKASPYMRATVMQNCAMGVFFMGSYIVTIPLVIRDVYGGSAIELAGVNFANSLGLVLTIMVLLKFGDIHRQGRALLLAQGIGSFALAGAGLGLGFNSLVVFIFLWGMCGGIAMTMARTTMQEMAPPDQRARMMAFFSFSFMGSGPVGALLSGALCEWLGPSQALIVSSVAMLVVVTIVSFRSSLWKLDTSPAAAGANT